MLIKLNHNLSEKEICLKCCIDLNVINQILLGKFPHRCYLSKDKLVLSLEVFSPVKVKLKIHPLKLDIYLQISVAHPSLPAC